MTPEHIRGWLKKKPTGAESLRLAVEASTTRVDDVHSWTADELEDRDNNEIARLIVAAGDEFTEAEGTPQKFFIQWLGARGNVIKSVTHRTTPPEKGDELAPLSTEQLMRAVLQANLDKDKSMISALDVSSKASDRTVKMLTDRLEDSQRRIAKLQKQAWDDEDRAGLVLPELPAEATEEQREEHRQRARAWSTLSDQMPSMVDMLISAFLSRFPPAEQRTTNGKRKKRAGGPDVVDATPKPEPDGADAS